MVKFSKELEAQLIPEWSDAFVKYRELKKQIKKIKLSRLPKQPQDMMGGNFGLSIFDPVRFLAKKICDKFRNPGNEADIIQVRSKSMEEGAEEDQVYQTELSQLFSQEDEVRIFFEKLDEELNEVNQFYKKKESDIVERAEILNKQLEILLELKQVLNHRIRKNSPSSPSLGNSPFSWSSPIRPSNYSESSIELVESPTDDQASETEEVIIPLERHNVDFAKSAGARPTKTKKLAGKPYNKMSMKIDIPAATPTRTIVAFTSLLWEDLVKNPKKEVGGFGESINRKKVQCAEKMIRGAFVELYRGLGLLKTYSSLNMVAFTKILKKFDKVSNQHASANYLQAVKASHFISSNKVVRVMDEVESIFIKHFANNDRKRAMKFLRPQQQKASHMVTFFVGLFTGCFVSLFTVYAILVHLSGIFSSGTEVDYMEIVYPICSMFALLSLHLFMYGCNLFMWKSKRINYNFIFEFSPNTALTYRDAFLICTTFMTIVVGAMVVHLLLRVSGLSPSQADAIPGILLLCFLALLICPLDIFYRPTRYCFIRVIRNIVCSPFYKVILVDFFMADQLTSQIPLLRQMESTACYFLAGTFRTHHYETCRSGRLFKELAYVISFLPYYWRAMQCARRWFDESDVVHLANMGKYVSAMVAAGARLTYHRQHDHLWLAIFLLTSVVATVYQCYWDFVMDWGLFNQNSKNLWLRDGIILKNKSIYYISIALNAVLRLAWLESVLPFKIDKVVDGHLVEFFLASLEVIRRGHWNFYRLENEHVNNVGKYRAVKEVPLPFHEMDSDG
ncbi:hypothetical protein I3843_02G094100 [Carya illinoinensis]|uniref:Phosphate transporter PHO1 n=2 Tax=Carya illinoinensis TaxID=32201 RepID=A0A8T1RE64_CARIL|nr:phosphate transporter PHO1-like [Carya illinoinensis]KAG6664653.1 hypothetical protein CIPAW_02G109100 [Carya illinoinensis]KAG6726966.1 hypothetical protein I3842_02G107700 [Carya illinoinensis]KAG7991756.1 hypothetical protein I3843_02G094100 [Carya illinoinensis]